jgi:AraC-like DNA-binding protein
VSLALRDHAVLTWFASFSELRQALSKTPDCTIILIGLADRDGASALPFAASIRNEATGTAIVACCEFSATTQDVVAELAAAGVHDVLFTGINDDAHAVRSVVFGACLGGAADVVMKSLEKKLPATLVRFVDLAVRRPRELQRVSDIAAALNVPRQTVGRWCRMHGYIGPEELMVWARLFLVAALLESNDRTIESVANDLHYGSPTALRNRIREYTGMTATELRSSGLAGVTDLFERRVREARADGSAAPQSGEGD